MSTIRGRVGTVVDRALIYATGGLAIGGYSQSMSVQTTTPAGTTTLSGSRSATRIGWALGAGIEFAATPTMSLRIEYLHVDLGHVSYTAGPLFPGTTYTTGRQHLQGNSVRLGANVHF